MTIPEFIKATIEGGYEIDESIPNHPSNLHRMLLDPKAWEAVGKVKGWQSLPNEIDFNLPAMKMVGMIHALWDGRTLEEYIATL